MARLHYKLNSETLLFEVNRTPRQKQFKRIFVGFLVSLLLSLGYYLVYIQYFDTPHSLSMRRNNTDLLVKYDLLNKRFEEANTKLVHIQCRDNNVYRATLGLDIIPLSVRDAGFGGVDRYSYFDKSDYATTLINTSRQLDILLKKAYVQSKSFDTIAKLAVMFEQMRDCIPYIPPTTLNKVKISDGFRHRINPVDGLFQHHNGMDFAGAVGTPVYATGNGVVKEIAYSYFGYGNQILIDHGFGYITRYAHLRTINVYKGQILKRGEQIATLGSTGKSTGPHLHYEVIYLGQCRDPKNYFISDITVEEYEKILTNAQENKEFD